MSEYRHEYKYICSEQQLVLINNNIQGIMECDSHAGDDGKYVIRSLYFDDYYDSCLNDNINGNDPREKFRVRIYDGDLSYIRLELKRKEKGKTKKLSCAIDETLCRKIMMGVPLEMDAVDADVYRKFCLLQNVRLLQPKIIVEYDRVPYVYRDGNVRVTFDRNIRSGNIVESFMDEHVITRPVMSLGQHVLEVKFDELIPDFLYAAAQIEKLRQTTYSKYYICRKCSLAGGNRV
ncbi:MAG: polyphosphate polymerase domain-containing protein [Lachnospiraceae bacterium]|nr:polyphosphate polymerase domain-containing protein [Lachnospiraceae bacterium]